MQFPHCDASVLHAPEDGCQFCNSHPEWQDLRIGWRINFTGHHDPDLTPCPSEMYRPVEVINRWGGNRAYQTEANDDQAPGCGAVNIHEDLRRKRWEKALRAFQTFFTEDRELRNLRDARDKIDQKIEVIERAGQLAGPFGDLI